MARRKTKSYGITKQIAEEHLHAWLEAEMAVTTSQSYQIGGRQLTRADLGEIRKQIEYWSNKVENLTAAEERGGRSRMFRAVPRDF